MIDKEILDRALSNYLMDRRTNPDLENTTWDLEMRAREPGAKKTTVLALDEATRSQYIARARAELGKAGR